MTADSSISLPDAYIAPEKDLPREEAIGREKEVAIATSFSQTPKPWHQVALPSLSFAGVQLAWAVLIGHATAHLRKLGVSDRAVGLAWLAGPISGTLVQPVVGALSDDCRSRLGRRRPFMLAGSVLTFVGLVLFSQAGEIAARVGDPLRRDGGGSRTGLVVGLVSFWVVDCGVNVLQTPTRALLADVVPRGQLAVGTALFAVANGVGKGIGYALGAFCPSIREAFAAAGVVVVVLTSMTAALIREKPVERDGGGERGFAQAAKESFWRSVAAVGELRGPLGRVFLVQWLTYLALMYLFIYGTDWVAREVFHGDGDSPPGSAAHARFEEGVRFGNVGLLGMAVASMALAPLTACAVRTGGVRAVWAACLAVMGGAFLLAPWAGRVGAAVMFAMASGAVGAALSIPWAIVSGVAGEDRGVRMAAFNLSQATPGLVATTTGGLLVHAGGGSLTGVMVAVGVCATCAAVAVGFVEVPVRGDLDGSGTATGDAAGNGSGDCEVRIGRGEAA